MQVLESDWSPAHVTPQVAPSPRERVRDIARELHAVALAAQDDRVLSALLVNVAGILNAVTVR